MLLGPAKTSSRQVTKQSEFFSEELFEGASLIS